MATDAQGNYYYDGASSPDFTKGFFNPIDSFMNSLNGFKFGGGSELLGGNRSAITPGGVPDSAVGDNSFMKTLFGGDGQAGQFGAIAGGIGDLAGGYLGLKNYELAKDAFKFQKESFNKNFQATGRQANTALNNRYTAYSAGRDNSTPNPFGTLDEYKQRTNIRGINA